MVSALVHRASGTGSRSGRGHCVVFLGKKINSHSASLHPGVQMGTGKLLGKLNTLRGNDLRWTSIPSRGSRNTPSRFMLQKPGRISSGAMSQSALRLHFYFSVATIFARLRNFHQQVRNQTFCDRHHLTSKKELSCASSFT